MSITWIYGDSGKGKSTLARKVGGIHLDGDDMRTVWQDLGFSNDDRLEQNRRVARLAKLLSDQGNDIVVSTIAPTESIRKEVHKICKPWWYKAEGLRSFE